MSTNPNHPHQGSLPIKSIFKISPDPKIIDETCDQRYDFTTYKGESCLKRQRDTASNIMNLARLAPHGFVTRRIAKDFAWSAANYIMACPDFSVVSLAKCLIDQKMTNSKSPRELLENFAKNIDCNSFFPYDVKSVMSKGLLDLIKTSSSVNDLLNFNPEGLADFLFLCFVFPSVTFVNLGDCVWFFLLGLLCPHAVDSTELTHLSKCKLMPQTTIVLPSASYSVGRLNFLSDNIHIVGAARNNDVSTIVLKDAPLQMRGGSVRNIRLGAQYCTKNTSQCSVLVMRSSGKHDSNVLLEDLQVIKGGINIVGPFDKVQSNCVSICKNPVGMSLCRVTSFVMGPNARLKNGTMSEVGVGFILDDVRDVTMREQMMREVGVCFWMCGNIVSEFYNMNITYSGSLGHCYVHDRPNVVFDNCYISARQSGLGIVNSLGVMFPLSALCKDCNCAFSGYIPDHAIPKVTEPLPRLLMDGAGDRISSIFPNQRSYQWTKLAHILKNVGGIQTSSIAMAMLWRPDFLCNGLITPRVDLRHLERTLNRAPVKRGGSWEESPPAKVARSSPTPVISFDLEDESAWMPPTLPANPPQPTWMNPPQPTWINPLLLPAQPTWTNSQPAQATWTNAPPAQPAWTNSPPAQPAWTNAPPAQPAWTNAPPAGYLSFSREASPDLQGFFRFTPDRD